MESLGTRVPVREHHPEGGSEHCCGFGFRGQAEALTGMLGFEPLLLSTQTVINTT
jgi:hypothetical protein